jgi:DNA-binding YbaB/EbfC family protein
MMTVDNRSNSAPRAAAKKDRALTLPCVVLRIGDRQQKESTMSMFDALKSLGNPMDLMRKAREMQENMQKMQDELARKTVSADAGGGMVSAVVNGRMEVVKVRIDKSKIDVNDTDLLEDVITAAIAAAQAKAAAMARDDMQKVAAEAGLPPGMLPGV